MRCKEGDRAVIVSGHRDNIGCLVDIERKASQGGNVWVVKTLGPTLVKINGEAQVLPARRLANIPDEFLWSLPLMRVNHGRT